MKDELKVLIPDQDIETSGGVVCLKPFKFKDFPRALKLVGDYVELIAKNDDTLVLIQTLLENSGEKFINDTCALIELVSGKNKEFLDDLGWDEVVNLIVVLIEQNKDFFSRLGKKLNPPKLEEEKAPTPKTGG